MGNLRPFHLTFSAAFAALFALFFSAFVGPTSSASRLPLPFAAFPFEAAGPSSCVPPFAFTFAFAPPFFPATALWSAAAAAAAAESSASSPRSSTAAFAAFAPFFDLPMVISPRPST